MARLTRITVGAPNSESPNQHWFALGSDLDRVRSLPAFFKKYLFQILKMYFSFFSTVHAFLSKDNSGIDLLSHFMAGLTVVDELQAYLLRIKHELDLCVEHIANISTNIQTIEHSCGHSLHEPCVRRRCKFDFNTRLLSAPTTFPRHRAKFILSNVALALGVKPPLDRTMIAYFLWNTGAKPDCDLLCPSTDGLEDAKPCLPRAWNRWVVCPLAY